MSSNTIQAIIGLWALVAIGCYAIYSILSENGAHNINLDDDDFNIEYQSMKSSTPFILLMVILVIILCSCAPTTISQPKEDSGYMRLGINHYQYRGCEYLIAVSGYGIAMTSTTNQPSTCKDY